MPMWSHIYTRLRPLFQSPAQILRHVPERAHILDIGCGYGDLCAQIAQCKSPLSVTGIDHDERKINSAQSRYPDLMFKATDVNGLQEIPQNVVLIIDVLHYFPAADQIALLRKCAASKSIHTLIARDIIKAFHPAYFFNRLHEFIMTRTGRTRVSHTQFSFFTQDEWRNIARDLNMQITLEKSGLPLYNDYLILFTK